MKGIRNRIGGGMLTLCLLACSGPVKVDRSVDEKPDIFPDYADVTVPVTIAPLNFFLRDSSIREACAVFSSAESGQFEVRSDDGRFIIPLSKWRKMLKATAGNSLSVTVAVKKGEEWIGYAPFSIRVALEPMDAYLAYRLIAPGYELWNRMGLYQRNLENYTQTAIMENELTGNNCMNCHSFCMQNPDKMLFHMRAKYAGTYLIDGDKVEKLNTRTPETMSALVYPSWHPSGDFVAFSVNQTRQGFHLNHKNRIEVYDEKSDVVVYDVKKHEIITAPQIFSEEAFETFPTFSPDGKRLYFCSAEARPIPREYSEIKYHLCAISFDPDTRTFGTQVDTLYNARERGQSVSFPRVSPDGRFLMYTLSGYGNFSIWHKDADLYLADLQIGTSRSMTEVNSPDVESYHSWSSNGRWFVFSSRRIDGLYTRPFIAYIDEEGNAGKPFLLPQKDAGFYNDFMYSYNIPEFVTGKVKVSKRTLKLTAEKEKGTDVKFVK